MESDQSETDAAAVGSDESQLLADDGFYRALAATPRRRLLGYLLEHDTATRDDLAAMLVGWETTETSGVAGPKAHQQMLVALEHAHLPVLESVGLVKYNTETGTVTLELNDEQAESIIRAALEHEA